MTRSPRGAPRAAAARAAPRAGGPRRVRGRRDADGRAQLQVPSYADATHASRLERRVPAVRRDLLRTAVQPRARRPLPRPRASTGPRGAAARALGGGERHETVDAPCEVWVMRVTDEASSSAGAAAERPEVFVSGALHGDERIGPVTALETARLLVKAAACVARIEGAAARPPARPGRVPAAMASSRRDHQSSEQPPSRAARRRAARRRAAAVARAAPCGAALRLHHADGERGRLRG